jgi:hypothetical protein
VFVVPGTYGSAGCYTFNDPKKGLKTVCHGTPAAAAEADRVLKAKFDLYWELAVKDPVVIGIKPWHFVNEMPVPANSSNAGFVNQFHLGATGYPQLMQAMETKGAAIKAKSGPHYQSTATLVAAQSWLSSLARGDTKTVLSPATATATAVPGSKTPLGAALKTDNGSCCVPDGSFICDGPCFVNGETLNSSERNVLKLFGPAGAFLNNTIHNTKTTFTENEVFTALPNDCRVYTGATVWRSDVKSGGQVVLEELFFSDDCSSFTKVVKGQQLPGPLICKIRCQRASVESAVRAPPGGLADNGAR